MSRRPNRARRGALCAGSLALVALAPSVASAGGFYFTDRGTRPAGRGFAFVAGVDDPSALYWNPGALYVVPNEFLADATFTLVDASFSRIDGGGNRLPTVSATATPPPIPMVAYTDDLGIHRDLTFGFGIYALNEVSLDWPSSIEVNGRVEPAPQRYSLISLDGSALVNLSAGAAYHVADGFDVGLALVIVTGAFTSEVAGSGCDRVVCTQPENPEYDGTVSLSAFPLFEPTAVVGARYELGDDTTIGASVALPHSLTSSGSVELKLPAAPIFNDASVHGDEVEIEIDFPWVLRAGVEHHFTPKLAVEAAVVYEGWSTQDRIRISGPNVEVRDVIGVGTYRLGTIDIPRGMNDVLSVRLGGEYALDDTLTLRAGANYENSSFDDAHLTPLTLDSDKLVVGLGASYRVSDTIVLDASYAHVFLRNREVRDSIVPQPSLIRPAPDPEATGTSGPVYVGNGDYAMEAYMLGIGLRITLDESARGRRRSVRRPDDGADEEREEDFVPEDFGPSDALDAVRGRDLEDDLGPLEGDDAPPDDVPALDGAPPVEASPPTEDTPPPSAGAGAPDAGAPDAGAPDAGAPDAGAPADIPEQPGEAIPWYLRNR